MDSAQTIRLLNRLLALQYRSLAMYLAETGTWVGPGDEQAEATLRNIATDQKAMCSRIAELILDLGGQVEPSLYPMEFTDKQFLALDYLLKELIHYQKQDVAAIERIVSQLTHPQARSLAEEALGAERAHLEALEELASQPAQGS